MWCRSLDWAGRAALVLPPAPGTASPVLPGERQRPEPPASPFDKRQMLNHSLFFP